MSVVEIIDGIPDAMFDVSEPAIETAVEETYDGCRHEQPVFKTAQRRVVSEDCGTVKGAVGGSAFDRQEACALLVEHDREIIRGFGGQVVRRNHERVDGTDIRRARDRFGPQTLNIGEFRVPVERIRGDIDLIALELAVEIGRMRRDADNGGRGRGIAGRLHGVEIVCADVFKVFGKRADADTRGTVFVVFVGDDGWLGVRLTVKDERVIVADALCFWEFDSYGVKFFVLILRGGRFGFEFERFDWRCRGMRDNRELRA